jgi:hypothetical protein
MSTIEQLFKEEIQTRTRNERLTLLSLIADSLTPKPRKLGQARTTRTKSNRLRSAIDVLNQTPGNRLFRTAEEIDAYIAQERASWER